MLHKLSSEDHIACKACGQDFNTTEGRDHHFRQVCLTLLWCGKISDGYRTISQIRKSAVERVLWFSLEVEDCYTTWR